MKAIYAIALLAIPASAHAGPISQLLQMATGGPAAKMHALSSSPNVGSITLGNVTCANTASPDDQPAENNGGMQINGGFQSADASADAAVMLGLSPADAKAIAYVNLQTSNPGMTMADSGDQFEALKAEKSAGCQIVNTNAKMIVSKFFASVQMVLILKSGTNAAAMAAKVSKSLGEGFSVQTGTVSSNSLGTDSLLIASQDRAVLRDSYRQLDADRIKLLK
ncbi:MAG: hypothetical protein ACXVCI_12645 [Bdellovibrionota bacterium]